MSGRAWEGIDRRPRAFEDILADSGPGGQRMLEANWRATPLGPLTQWPESLRQTVSTMLGCGQPMALWYGPDLTTIFNETFVPILGSRAGTAMARPLVEVWPDVYELILPMARRALSGETVWMEDLPLTMTRNGFEEETFWTFSYSPVRDDRGRIGGFLDVVTETTQAVRSRRAIEAANAALEAEFERTRAALAAHREAERQRAILHRELMHRMKNMLAVVQAIVLQSLRNADSVAAAQAAVISRIGSFARAQDVVQGEHVGHADLRALIESAIEPHRDRRERVRLDGPPVDLGAQQATWVALAVNELATNAVKYGALSTPDGVVSIGWSIVGDRLTLDWRERGGPPVSAPMRPGFGARLTRHIIPTSLGGEASLDWSPEGLDYRLVVQLTQGGDAPAPA